MAPSSKGRELLYGWALGAASSRAVSFVTFWVFNSSLWSREGKFCPVEIESGEEGSVLSHVKLGFQEDQILHHFLFYCVSFLSSV